MPFSVSSPSLGNAPLTPPNNGSWSATPIYFDPQNSTGNASDSNPGTLAKPVLNYARAASYWGTVSPVLRQNTRLIFLSSHTTNSDPVIFTPVHANGAWSSIESVPTVIATGLVLASVVAFSDVAGANSLLLADLGALAAPGQIVENTTAGKSSRAIVYKLVSGTTYSLSQPLGLMAVGSNAGGAQVNTWANGDTVNLLQPCAIDLVKYDPLLADSNVTFSSHGFLYQVDIFAPAGGSPNAFVELGQWVRAYEGISHRRALFAGRAQVGPSNGQGTTLINFGCLAFVGGGEGSPPFFSGGYVNTAGGTQLACASFNNRFILAGATTFYRAPLFINSGMWIDGNIATYGDFQLNSGTIAGSAGRTINMLGQSRLSIPAGSTFTATLTAPGIVTGVLLNGAATGNSFAGGVINPGIATTPANLDAAAGVAGFGGLAFNLGGASIAKAA
jgi:hypothetical protein